MLVEDDQEDYEFTRELFSAAHTIKVKLSWVSNATDALQLLKQESFDAVLVDFYLSSINGASFIREAIVIRADIPYILLTGSGNPQIDQQALDAGAVDYLVKGEVTVGMLERSIRYSIEHVRHTRALEQARKQMEMLAVALHDSNERFRIAIYKSPITVYTTELNLRYPWLYNTSLGFTIEQALGKRDDELLPEADVSELIDLKQQVLNTGVGARKEVLIHVAGRPAIFDVTVEPLIDSESCLQGLTVAAMNITERRRLEELRQRATAQVEVQRRLMEHREQERNLIARDLHDGPLQELISTNFALSDLIDIPDETQRAERLRQIMGQIQNQIKELRTFCYDLRPPALAPFGLQKAILSHMETFKQRNTGIKFSLDLEHDGERVAPPVRMALFRIYQELLNNIVRHSKASEAHLSMRIVDDEVIMEMSDNGVGFNLPDEWVDLARKGHLGMVGILERIESVGGTVSFTTSPGKGVRVVVKAPCDIGEREKPDLAE